MGNDLGIRRLSLESMPVAVIDFETTGLSPGYDRVVEVSVVRLDPGDRRPRLVFDSLINPGRRVGATYVHGIRDQDVVGAPRFEEIAGDLVYALSGCVISAYNAYFDMGFLDAELSAAKHPTTAVPFVCARWMRSLLKLGRACKLGDACREHGVPYTPLHHASVDAIATAGLMVRYLEAAKSRGIDTFADLAALGKHKYLQSFAQAPFRLTDQRVGARVEIKSRSGFRYAQ